MKELAGSLGDLGTFIPLAICYISVCRVNPAGLLVMMGLSNIATGIAYRLPMPIQPMKVRTGFAQIPLTATTAVIATSALIMQYWPTQAVSEKKLSFNMGVMNLIAPFLGGIPMCHGAGGLAGQYYFGARTGGTNIIEGALELALGLFLATSIAGLLTHFPIAIIGAMMMQVGIEMITFARDVRFDIDLPPLAATVAVALIGNMALGFLGGLAAHCLLRRFHQNTPKEHMS